MTGASLILLTALFLGSVCGGNSEDERSDISLDEFMLLAAGDVPGDFEDSTPADITEIFQLLDRLCPADPDPIGIEFISFEAGQASINTTLYRYKAEDEAEQGFESLVRSSLACTHAGYEVSAIDPIELGEEAAATQSYDYELEEDGFAAFVRRDEYVLVVGGVGISREDWEGYARLIDSRLEEFLEGGMD